MAASDDHFVNGSLAPVLWCELALLNASLYEKVLALLIRRRHRSQFVMKGQTVPIGVADHFAVFVPVKVVLREANIRHPRTGGHQSDHWLCCQNPGNFNPVLLHHHLRLSLLPIQFPQKSCARHACRNRCPPEPTPAY